MATNSYDNSNTLSTTIKPRGMDIGPIPDFYGDLRSIVQNLRPVPRMATGSVGPSQASALRTPSTIYQTPGSTGATPSDQVRQAQERAAIIAADEASRPAPMRFLNSGPGITGGYVTDPNAMDANQRKMFLPNNSSQEQTPWATESQIGNLHSNNLGPWELGGNRQAFSAGAPSAGSGGGGGGKSSSPQQQYGYQGQPEGQGQGGPNQSRIQYGDSGIRTDYNGVSIPQISAGLGPWGKTPAEQAAWMAGALRNNGGGYQ